MLSKLIRRMRGSKKDSDVAQLLPMIDRLSNQRATLQQDLSEASETISSLRAQLAEYDLLVTHLQSRTHMSTTPPTPHTDDIQTSIQEGPDTWIANIWLSSDNESGPLAKAEQQWQDGCPDFAMDIVSRAICTDPFLPPVEEIRCRIFVAAVLHSLGRYEESNKRVDVALQMLSRHDLFDSSHTRHFTGVAHYIRGRNLLTLKEFTEAYWSLARALCTPGYHTKSRHYQRKAIEDFTREEAVDGHSVSSKASIRPLLGSADSRSSLCLVSPDLSSQTSPDHTMETTVFTVREPACSPARSIDETVFADFSTVVSVSDVEK
ncbi:hypothetical protein N7474_007964 [Penicillium riverlandense]|uniref:uncharacterized protein n=1 Tax=Penicillium riverlandense TaxID=1903569 RepID=UPI002546DFC8|nr:uncharacterized protein N7474_007964 [Penicillium riverlandense]KAJ5811663.1 hypothetical protein N7474_007964 [Penicillium riverlandense]